MLCYTLVVKRWRGTRRTRRSYAEGRGQDFKILLTYTYMTSQHITLYTDGGARGNPGTAGCGFVAYDDKGEELFFGALALGKQTNNIAEYEGLIGGLLYLKKFLGTHASGAEVRVCMDSELIVKQMKGEYKVRHPSLKEKYDTALQLLSVFKVVNFSHIPREKNARADMLANEAMDRV